MLGLPFSSAGALARPGRLHKNRQANRMRKSVHLMDTQFLRSLHRQGEGMAVAPTTGGKDEW